MIELIALTAAVIAVLWYLFVWPLNYWSRLGTSQSKPWIFFGDFWMLLFKQYSVMEMVEKLYSLYPNSRYTGLYKFNSPVLLLRDPELIKQIGVKDFEHFTDHLRFADVDADPLWGNGLFALEGERWREIRQTLTPTFTSSKVKGIYKLILNTTESFIKYFEEKNDDVIEVEFKDVFSRFANDVIATTAFGVQVNSLKDQKNEFYEMGVKITDFGSFYAVVRGVGHQVFSGLLKFFGIPLLDKGASTFFSSIIGQAIKIREEQHIVRSDMLNLLLDARKEGATGKTKAALKISDSEITSQALVFFFAGFDTVSTALSFSSYELAVNKDVQDRLREEINETQKNGKVTYEELMGMKYLDMVISEVLRKWPSVPNLERMCTKAYTIQPVNESEKPIPITLRQEIWIPVYGIHHDPKYYPNPEQFYPERFSEENKDAILPYTYMPFGVGPRTCIGNRFALVEIKALLFNLLLNYEIVPTKKTQIPLILAKDFSIMAEGGMCLGLKRVKS